MTHAPLPRLAAALALATGMLAPPMASAVNIDWVTVGAPGNAADTVSNCGISANSPCGAVAYTYNIGKYQVTNAQYAEFLNKVAATDTNGLYNPLMNLDPAAGGITQNGSSGSYSYTVKSGFDDKPVTYVSFWDATRFTNWLQNGQPMGLQTSLTTEDGAYTLTPAAMAANSVLRNANASIFLPSENEWYKAAYYDPIAGHYWTYPTGTNATFNCGTPGSDTGNSGNCGGAVGGTTAVGAYKLSHSPNGTFDQGGNVFEFNDSIKEPHDPPYLGSYRGFRGGDFRLAALYAAKGCIDASGGYYCYIFNDYENFDRGYTGFRVASIPEPSTALLVGTGLLGFATRRRRRA